VPERDKEGQRKMNPKGFQKSQSQNPSRSQILGQRRRYGERSEKTMTVLGKSHGEGGVADSH
jgi:hypothetical protein